MISPITDSFWWVLDDDIALAETLELVSLVASVVLLADVLADCCLAACPHPPKFVGDFLTPPGTPAPPPPFVLPPPLLLSGLSSLLLSFNEDSPSPLFILDKRCFISPLIFPLVSLSKPKEPRAFSSIVPAIAIPIDVADGPPAAPANLPTIFPANSVQPHMQYASINNTTTFVIFRPIELLL